MIVKMRHLDLVCVAAEKDSTLKALRALGAVHLDLAKAQGGEVTLLKGDIEAAERALRVVDKARREYVCGDSLEEMSVSDILALGAKLDELKVSLDCVEKEIAKYAPYGDFDPALARKLLDAGIDLASVAELPDELPSRRLSEMQAEAENVAKEIKLAGGRLACADTDAIKKMFPSLADKLAFGAAKELMAQQGAVAFIAGWLPVSREEELRAAAHKSGWGVLLRDPLAEEMPPTLVEPPKMFRPMKELFNGLGIAPAYTEADVSVPFMCYFSLFFAMLVGDGAYGAIFLILTVVLRKELPRSWLVLLSVFSGATVLWGILSNTWFGAAIPFLADLPTVKWLGDPSYHNMMLLCFTIGVSHLTLARIWNGICKFPDSTCVAEFGWAGVLLFMYFVTNSIVGIFTGIPSWAYWMFGVSLVAVFGFSVKVSELRSRGAELGMLPLNIMSALGDIISYVRLFAVGLASVKVAENFNSMALGLVDGEQAFWLKALLSVAMVLILLVGHGLNLAMAGLSILVHAVRLNTLEFSNHKGVSWSGYAYKPFKAQSKEV